MKESVLRIKEKKGTQHWFSYFEIAGSSKNFSLDILRYIKLI